MDRGPYVPVGWDRWFAKTNEALATTYYRYPVIDQGVTRLFGRGPGDYVTDVLGREALAFVRTAPNDRPWFLLFSPPAPHEPWTPAPRHEGALGVPELFVGQAPPPAERPAWMNGLPALGTADQVRLAGSRRRADETMLAVDEYLHALVQAAVARGEWDRTVVMFLSDNGVHFGERGWFGKRVPYEPSIRIPFAIRWPPDVTGASSDALVANLDVAPTIAALAGVTPGPADGRSLLDPVPADRSIPLWWVGDDEVPAWRGVRTARAVLIEWSTGERELYDVANDPAELRNLFRDPAWRPARERLRALLPEASEAPG